MTLVPLMTLEELILSCGSILILLWTWRLNHWPTSFPRNENQNMDLFLAVGLCMVVVTACSISPVTRPGLLNRHQTNEWKGWMQLIFLLYHYYRATWVYNEVRVFVSCYMWLTGFGNFMYFTKKKDFSFGRVMSTLIRINLLTVGLMLVHGTSVMLYYVVPLHTGFFLLTWISCWCIERTGRPKTILLATLVFLIFVFEWWKPFQGDVAFRFGLDRYSTWWGMVCAYVQINHSLSIHYGVALLIGIACCSIWYVLWGHLSDKYRYNPYHPYIVILPIVGYIAIRNCHPVLRKHYSKGLAWVGGVTLETYVLQFHILMCRNVQHILVLIPGFEVFNTCVVSVLFFAVSYMAREITVRIQLRVTELLKSNPVYLPVQQNSS